MVRVEGNHGPTEPLHIIVQCEDIESLVEEKMRNAIEKINVLLHPPPEGKDELKRKQLVELSIINGTYRPTAATKNALQTPRPHVLPSGGIISPQALAFTPRDKPTKMSMEKKKVNDILHQNQLMSMMALFQPTTTRQESECDAQTIAGFAIPSLTGGLCKPTHCSYVVDSRITSNSTG
ncbi:unnamed protein product, partial [Mesorhabditis belari]|uniref:Uncharacterized protein n=1 Tax=Mesorhabditis belari TaxID=2138241 RepID=A0AAF3FM70_9BILA